MKALTIGGATIDTIVSLANDRDQPVTDGNADAACLQLELGQKRDAKDISVHSGGGAVNAAVAMARLGHETSIIVKLGRDFRADIILTQLAAEGISTAYVHSDSLLPSGASVLISAHDGNTAVLTFRGANTTLAPQDLPASAFEVDLVNVSGLSDQSADCLGQIVRQAKSAGALVAVNPGIRQLTTRQDAFCAALSLIDILAVNKSEAAVLLPWLSTLPDVASGLRTEAGRDVPGFAWSGNASDDKVVGLLQFCRSLNDLGPRWVVVTDSQDGAYVGTSSGLLHCSALKVAAVGTAGAGDAFTSTFAAGIASGATTELAVRAATINSASVVSHLSTRAGLLTGPTMAARLAEPNGSLRVRHWPFH